MVCAFARGRASATFVAVANGVKRGYDWTACLIAVAAGLGVAAPLGVVADWLFDSVDSGLLLIAVVTTAGTVVARVVYARLAKPGARPLDPD